MTTDSRKPGDAQSPDFSPDDPDRDLPAKRKTPPPQDWKHPDDGTELSERDIEIPLKP